MSHEEVIQLRRAIIEADQEEIAMTQEAIAIDDADYESLRALREQVEELEARELPVSLFPVNVIACGHWFTAAVSHAGEVFTWGFGRRGQLGLGEAVDCTFIPQRVEGIRNAVGVACGDDHTAVLLDNGRVVTFGSNMYGQLGHCGLKLHEFIPREVDGLMNIIQIACGDNHTVALDEEGRMYIFGNRYDEEEATGPRRLVAERSDITFIAAGYSNSAFITQAGQAFISGENWSGDDNTFRLINEINDAETIACGGIHVAIICRNGRVMTMGSDVYGQLGRQYQFDNQYRARVVESLAEGASEAACGFNHTLVVKKSGALLAFGRNNIGQLGIGLLHEIRFQPQRVVGIKNVIAVSASASHTTAVTQDGRIYTWGFGKYGQLGLGSQENEAFPRLIGTLIL